MTVTIPSSQDHCGYPGCLVTITISDTCPVCGGPRGKPYKGISYDGSRRLVCDRWDNPCGHVDLYKDVIAAKAGTDSNVGSKAEP